MSLVELKKNIRREPKNVPVRRIINSLIFAGGKKRKKPNKTTAPKKKQKKGLPTKIRKYKVTKKTCGGTRNIYLLDLHERELHYALCALYNLKKVSFCMVQDPLRKPKPDKRWDTIFQEMKIKNIPHEILTFESLNAYTGSRDVYKYVIILSGKTNHDYNLSLNNLTLKKVKEWFLIQERLRNNPDFYGGKPGNPADLEYHVQMGILLEYPEDDIREYLEMNGWKEEIDFDRSKEKLEELLENDKKRKKILKK